MSIAQMTAGPIYPWRILRLGRRLPGCKQWLLGALVLCCVLPANAKIDCRTSTGQVRDCSILLVHSYHPSLKWVQILSDNFETSVASASHSQIHTEYLDAKLRPTLEHGETFIQLLREKYTAQPPDVLVISDDPAFDMLWPIRDELLPGVPVVFMGLNSARKEFVPGVRGVTGIIEQHSTAKTVEIALELTNAPGIVVLNDTSETGKANEVTLRELVKAHPDLHWVIERDLSAQDVDRITSWPRDWPVITMLPLRRSSRDGPMLSQTRSIELLRQTIPNPLFYDSEWMMGNGLVGGYSLSGSDHARQAGELVVAILSGTAPHDLAVRFDTAHQWIFDQRELDRFGWSDGRLPADAVILFKADNFWERNQKVIYPLLAALAIAAVIIVMLTVMLHRQRKVEARLRTQEQRLSTALAATDAGVFEVRPDGRYASPRWLELVRVDATQNIETPNDNWMNEATQDSRKRFEGALGRLNSGTQLERIELTIGEDRARILDVLLTIGADQPNRREAIVGVATDITATRQFQEEALRRNRLEIHGELAGGIAHDFNNILMVINYSAKAAGTTDDPALKQQLLADIEEAGLRATDIVKQLLTFGKHDPQPRSVIDLNASVRQFRPFLQRMLGANCQLVTALHSAPLGASIDKPQFERVLSNLVVNARDALSNTGKVFVDVLLETTNDVEYAVITVRDEGKGMDEITRARMFEPFFSTKTVDKGTGLGLSTVYGIVSSSGGEISVKSQPGTGTTFRLVWPRKTLADSAAFDQRAPSTSLAGKSILLVEDDHHVGTITLGLLQNMGAQAVLAQDGQQGLQMFSDRPDDFDLVLSDVVLPVINGIELAAKIRRMKPSVRVAFISGHTRHPSLRGAPLPAEFELLKKPFTQSELASFVRRQFDRRDPILAITGHAGSHDDEPATQA